MTFRSFCAATLGVVMLSAIHGCASDDDSGSADAGATTGAGGTSAAAGRESNGGADAAGGTNDAGGEPSTGGTLGTSGSASMSEAGKSGNRGGSGGTRTGTGGTRSSSGGTRASTGGSRDDTGGVTNGSGDEGGEAGAEAGAPSSGGALTAGGASSAGSAGTSSASGGANSGGAGTSSASGGASSGGSGMGGAETAGTGTSAGTGGAAGGQNGGCVDTLNLPLLSEAPATLDLTGLYTSPDSDPTDTAPYVEEYTPRYALWSDGANKKRWIYLPACTQIDTSDMNHWVFPVGTRFWKEFRIGDTLVETRFIHRFGPGAGDWLFAAYQWDPNVASPTAGNTIYVPHGVGNANGTPHDIPDQSDCGACHEHLPEHVLGFGAFELTGNPGAIDINVLSEQHLLTVEAPNGFTPPGTSTQQAGLGYLHANCGICHSAFFSATPTSPPQMRLLVEQTTLESTDTYTTMVNVPTQNYDFLGIPRIKPGDHAGSEVYMRMSVRNDDQHQGLQMPPLATEDVDPDGVATVSAFIDSLGQ